MLMVKPRWHRTLKVTCRSLPNLLSPARRRGRPAESCRSAAPGAAPTGAELLVAVPVQDEIEYAGGAGDSDKEEDNCEQSPSNAPAAASSSAVAFGCAKGVTGGCFLPVEKIGGEAVGPEGGRDSTSTGWILWWRSFLCKFVALAGSFFNSKGHSLTSLQLL